MKYPNTLSLRHVYAVCCGTREQRMRIGSTLWDSGVHRGRDCLWYNCARKAIYRRPYTKSQAVERDGTQCVWRGSVAQRLALHVPRMYTRCARVKHRLGFVLAPTEVGESAEPFATPNPWKYCQSGFFLPPPLRFFRAVSLTKWSA